VGFSRVCISTGQSGLLSDGATFPIHITAQNRFFGQTIFKIFIATDAVLTSGSPIAEIRNLQSRQQPLVAELRDSSQNAAICSRTSRFIARCRDLSRIVANVGRFTKKPLKATIVSRSPHEFSKSQQSASVSDNKSQRNILIVIKRPKSISRAGKFQAPTGRFQPSQKQKTSVVEHKGIVERVGAFLSATGAVSVASDVGQISSCVGPMFDAN
jgi:hypothetical protein